MLVGGRTIVKRLTEGQNSLSRFDNPATELCGCIRSGVASGVEELQSGWEERNELGYHSRQGAVVAVVISIRRLLVGRFPSALRRGKSATKVAVSPGC